jgi:hypothetical protein
LAGLDGRLELRPTLYLRLLGVGLTAAVAASPRSPSEAPRQSGRCASFKGHFLAPPSQTQRQGSRGMHGPRRCLVHCTSRVDVRATRRVSSRRKWLAVPRWVTPKGAHAAFSLDFFDARLLPRDIEQSNLPRSPARLHSTARRGERNRNVVGLSRAVCRVTTEADRAGDTRTGGCAAGRQPPRW